MPEPQRTLSPSAPTPTNARPPPARAGDLTVNKIISGAGAAATTAALGSIYGAAGTVAGAAMGSVVSTVGTMVYQRSLDRTRDTVRARVRLSGGRSVDVADELEVPAPRLSPDDGPGRARVYVSPVEPPHPTGGRRGRFALAAGATLVVFILGMLAVTGVEWIKGSTLTAGQSGTSVGRVLDGGSPASEMAPDQTSETTEPTEDPTSSPESSTPDSSDSSSTKESSSPEGSTVPDEEDAEGGGLGQLRPTGVPTLPQGR